MDELTRLALAARDGDPARIAALVRASYRARAHERAHDAVDAARQARERSDQLRIERELRRQRADRCHCSGGTPIDPATAALLRERLGRAELR